jgi:hypothetical protein
MAVSEELAVFIFSLNQLFSDSTEDGDSNSSEILTVIYQSNGRRIPEELNIFISI